MILFARRGGAAWRERSLREHAHLMTGNLSSRSRSSKQCTRTTVRDAARQPWSARLACAETYCQSPSLSLNNSPTAKLGRGTLTVEGANLERAARADGPGERMHDRHVANDGQSPLRRQVPLDRPIVYH
eukprot:3935810-Rhodomonas_salina.2